MTHLSLIDIVVLEFYIMYLQMRRIQQQLRERDNCHPFKAFPLVFCQLPVWFGISLALRNMTGSVFLGRHGIFKKMVFNLL